MTLNLLTFYGLGKYCMLTFVAFVGISLMPSFAQSAKISQDEIKTKSAAWQSLLQNQSVEINYKYTDCNLPSEGTHNEYYYLKVINKTDKKLQVEWMEEVWYNGKCSGCGATDKENKRLIILLPGEAKEGACDVSADRNLKIFSKMLNWKLTRELTNFNLKELKVTIL